MTEITGKYDMSDSAGIALKDFDVATGKLKEKKKNTLTYNTAKVQSDHYFACGSDVAEMTAPPPSPAYPMPSLREELRRVREQERVEQNFEGAKLIDLPFEDILLMRMPCKYCNDIQQVSISHESLDRANGMEMILRMYKSQIEICRRCRQIISDVRRELYENRMREMDRDRERFSGYGYGGVNGNNR